MIIAHEAEEHVRVRSAIEMVDRIAAGKGVVARMAIGFTGNVRAVPDSIVVKEAVGEAVVPIASPEENARDVIQVKAFGELDDQGFQFVMPQGDFDLVIHNGGESDVVTD